MRLTNLGTVTELAVLGEAAAIDDRGDHLVVRCPDMPGFYWGNHLLLDRAPAADRVDHWLAAFAEAFPDPRVEHVAIGWQDPTGDTGAVEAFADRGYLLDDCCVTALSAPPPRRPPPEGLTVEVVREAADWQALERLAMLSRDRRHTEAAYARYINQRFARRRQQAEQGALRWFAAKLDGHIVGDMGLFVVPGPPKGLDAAVDVPFPIARFQDVSTHPDFRRRGICSALLTEVCHRALGPMGLKRLVILVDEDGPAWGVYRRHGFRPVARVRGVWKPPADKWQADAGPD